jgi:CO/xanthine dehydrogenase FAD-binding subunit
MDERGAGTRVSSFDLVAPATVEEAIATLRTGAVGDVAVLAGGTDLLLDLDEGRVAPKRLVSLRRLPWRTLDWTEDALTIGSMLPLQSLESDATVRRRLPGLWQAVHAVGSVALRHRATLGGNLGRSAPASDLVPMLLALGAEVEVVGSGGGRRMPVDAFVRGSRRTALQRDELIRSIRVPVADGSAYLWQRVRPANDISQVAVAVAHTRADRGWRVAVGGVPPRPVLLPDVATILGDGIPDDARVAEAGARASRDVALVADRRASEEYRRRLVGTLLARAVRSVLRAEGSRR